MTKDVRKLIISKLKKQILPRYFVRQTSFHMSKPNELKIYEYLQVLSDMGIYQYGASIDMGELYPYVKHMTFDEIEKEYQKHIKYNKGRFYESRK